jgi:class 3 adenylate cyclase
MVCMFDETLIKDLIEMCGKSLSFTDVEAIGGYLFKKRSFSIHESAGLDPKRSISPLNAAKILVEEVEKQKRLKDLFTFTIELDGSPLNGKVVTLDGLENLLYRLARTGQYFDFAKRKFVDIDDATKLLNWGALRDGREYPFVIASVDICQNSELVKKYTTKVMEKVYYRLWAFLKARLDDWEGRIWSWAGDGGILAFRGDQGINQSVSCCLEILSALTVFNMQPDKAIKDDVHMRIGLDFGPVKFFSDTGRIVSDVINYAAHLEKKGTKPCALSISDAIASRLSPSMKKVFPHQMNFEGRLAMTTE